MICAESTNHFEHLIFTCRQNFIHVQLFNMCSIAAAFFPAQIRRLSKTRNSETWRARREVGFLGTWSFPGCEPKWPLRSPEYLLGLEDPQRFQKEAVERGEKALEDKPEGNTSEDAEGKMSPLQEDKRMIVQKEPQPKVPIRVLPASLCSPRLIRHLTLLRWAKTTLPTAPMTRR